MTGSSSAAVVSGSGAAVVSGVTGAAVSGWTSAGVSCCIVMSDCTGCTSWDTLAAVSSLLSLYVLTDVPAS